MGVALVKVVLETHWRLDVRLGYLVHHVRTVPQNRILVLLSG